MEVGLRLLGAVLILIKWLTYPIFLWRSYTKKRALPLLIDPLLKISATKLATEIINGNVSSEDVVRAYIKRIQDVNPILNAVVEDRFDAALEDAMKIDKFIDENSHLKEELKIRKPLLGVPFTVKESCSVAGLSYSIGSIARRGIKAKNDGEAVERLKAAGGIPLLVSNTPELCLFWETNNLIHGTTCNPYNTNHSSAGSSGGEGALLGAGASVIGIGSDIAGSIRIPAMFNGIFGHKPTPGLVPITGHHPQLQDENFSFYLTIGPMTRYSEDLLTVMKVLVGNDSAEKVGLASKVDLGNLDVYYMTDLGFSLVIQSVDDDIKNVILASVKHLEQNCGSTVKNIKFEELEVSHEISISLFLGIKDKNSIMDDPKHFKSTYKVLIELIKSIMGVSKYSLNVILLFLLEKCNAGIPRKNYARYTAECKALREKFMATLGTSGIFLYPTFPTSAFLHGEVYTKLSGIAYTLIFNMLGFPSVHVPIGFDKSGMPIGLQVVAAPYKDRLCFAVASELESRFGGWIMPE